jgi:D-sedoheptulose 7-phosphate isomerase
VKLTADGDRRARSHLAASASLTARVADECLDSIFAAAEAAATTLAGGGKLLLCGNGGSASDAQHLAAELVSRFDRTIERRALPAIALTTDSSVLTAIANDDNFENVFKRQVEALGAEGDALVCISTSGASENVRRAAAAARQGGVRTIGLLGEGGPLSGEVDIAVLVPSTDTQLVQEALLAVEHVFIDLVERSLFDPGPDAR